MDTLELLPGVLGTPTQIAVELRAARLFRLPAYQAAVTGLRDVVFRSEQIERDAGLSTWERAMQELAFAFLIRNLNSDPLGPNVLWDQNPPHLARGTAVPGSRCTGNNPDTIYRRIPVDASSRYVLRGRRLVPQASDITISVLPTVAAQETWTQTTLRGADIDSEADGEFAVTVDACESCGRRNHLTLAAGAVRLTLRESMVDWATERPWILAIERIGGCAPMSDENDEAIALGLAMRLPAFAHHWIDFARRRYFSSEPNVLKPPSSTPAGLATQLTSLGNFKLRDDEALVIRIDPLNAAYCAFQVLDPWLFGLEYRCRTGSLNHGQSIADADGALTVVVSAHDPGVHNWIDTGGTLQGTMQTRWQGLPPGRQPQARAIHVERMPLDAAAALDLPCVTAAERRQQIHARRAGHDRRFSDTLESADSLQAVAESPRQCPARY